MRITFDPERKNILMSRWRKRMLPPYDVLKRLGIKSNDIVADIGCGPGFFTLPASEYADDGLVYGLDLSTDMLKTLKSQSGAAKIKTVQTESYDMKLPDATVTFALLSSVIHEIDDIPRFLTEIKRIMVKDGRLAIIEWQKKELDMGPSPEHKFSPTELIKAIEPYFSHFKTINFNDYYYGCIFINDKQKST